MAAPANPKPGDVVVELRRLDGALVHVIRHTTGAGQYAVRSRDEAVMRAIRFAKRLGVRAWLTEEGTRFVPLDHARDAKPDSKGNEL